MRRIVHSVLIVLVSCTCFAQKVHIDYDKNADFSKFRTYVWLESRHPVEGLRAQVVVDGIDKQLTSKGLKKVDESASPDLEVVYHAGVKERTIVEGYDYGYVLAEYLYSQIYGRLWFWPTPGTWVSQIQKKGTLVVDLVDTTKKEMVWRGVAVGTLSETTKENERKLNKAIKKMFKRYPPKKSCR